MLLRPNRHNRNHKLRKAFSKCGELVEKYNFSMKTLLQQGMSKLEFYGDLVYRITKMVKKSIFSKQFRKLINRYERTEYNLDTACLVVNPITVDSYTLLFNCTSAVMPRTQCRPLHKTCNLLCFLIVINLIFVFSLLIELGSHYANRS